jgi:hypothetical protein
MTMAVAGRSEVSLMFPGESTAQGKRGSNLLEPPTNRGLQLHEERVVPLGRAGRLSNHT